ncbi:MAG: succinate--CoA ligase subunit alpha [Aigarchaeota archaeon]|nr:succinate--CoA ligase subunit alpha [Aigarchaeota archaeon]MDW8092324.1 succinate--CoA ligase subunit alpha [Nitrososphaerota archaeon]
MAILVNRETRVVVQGVTGKEGRFHTSAMLRYGTKVLAGVTPNKGGERVDGVPVYDSVREAVERHPEINTSAIFVPAKSAPDAVYEAIDSGIKTVVVITEGIPIHETMAFVKYARYKGVNIIGPNCPGLISPNKSKVGIMPANVFSEGPVGIISRSGTLTYEVALNLTNAKIGQSTAVGIGGDPVVGTQFVQLLDMFRGDDETSCVILIGEIGGDAEERAADYIRRTNYNKPVLAFIAGTSAPPGKRMGHAGAIISMGVGDAASKIKRLSGSGVRVAQRPSELVRMTREALGLTT